MKALKHTLSALVVVAALAGASGAQAAGGVELKKQVWPWAGIFGSYNQDGLRRGFQVYREVCSNCHSLRLVSYRNLADLGFTADQIKEIAAEREVLAEPRDDGKIMDEQGNLFTRPAIAADKFVDPYPNEAAAKAANGGALPPDLSLMAKARVGGPDYIYSLMTGYVTAPLEVTVAPGKSYNAYFPGHMISMPAPLFEGAVEYADGTEATLDQMARDVAQFLNWAAEPELNERHALGLKFMLFLFVLTALMYALKRKIWEDVPH